MKTPRFDHVILCDEIRREDNGKILVIGMYTGQVIVPRLPFVLPTLTFWCQWQVKLDYGFDGCFEIFPPHGEKLHTISFSTSESLPAGETAFLGIAVRNFRFMDVGEHVLNFRPSKGRSKKMFSFEVAEKQAPRKKPRPPERG